MPHAALAFGSINQGILDFWVIAGAQSCPLFAEECPNLNTPELACEALCEVLVACH
jgi:hypothetical protein